MEIVVGTYEELILGYKYVENEKVWASIVEFIVIHRNDIGIIDC